MKITVELSEQDINDLLQCINRQWEVQTSDIFYDRLADLEGRLVAAGAKMENTE